MGKLGFAALFVVASVVGCASAENTPGAVDVGDGLRRSLSRDASTMSVSSRADGTKSVHFNGGFQHAHVVRVGPDGSLKYSCVTDADDASKFLAGGQ
jgi:hypothetical protein